MTTKNAERQRRYRARQQAKAGATFTGAREIELAWFGINREGEYVAIPYDGDSLILTPASKPVEPEPAKPKKVYVPKSWEPSEWNHYVTKIREQSATKDQVRHSLDNAKKATPKQVEHFRAVIDALPDTPDWYLALPLAPEKDS